MWPRRKELLCPLFSSVASGLSFGVGVAFDSPPCPFVSFVVKLFAFGFGCGTAALWLKGFGFGSISAHLRLIFVPSQSVPARFAAA
jgi:hypothetical protein